MTFWPPQAQLATHIDGKKTEHLALALSQVDAVSQAHRRPSPARNTACSAALLPHRRRRPRPPPGRLPTSPSPASADRRQETGASPPPRRRRRPLPCSVAPHIAVPASPAAVPPHIAVARLPPSTDGRSTPPPCGDPTCLGLASSPPDLEAGEQQLCSSNAPPADSSMILAFLVSGNLIIPKFLIDNFVTI